MAKTIEQLKAQSAEIKNASVVGENTATRVGNLFNDIVEKIEQVTADGSTTTAKLAPLAVTTEKIANGAVTGGKIAAGTITEDNIADKSLSQNVLANNAVNTDIIQDGAVTSEKLADSAMSQAMTTAISDEAQARAKADEQLNTAIVAEKNRAEAVEKVNADNIAKNAQAITDEVARAQEAELANTSAIEAEKNRAEAAEEVNAQAITSETKRATKAEANISTEVAKKIDATNFNNQLQKKADKDEVAASLIALENKIGERTEIAGDIVNNPDEEDLTTQEGKLTLKNRAYEPLNYSGKGYEILRKNMTVISVPSATITVISAPITDGYISVIVDGIEIHIDVTTADTIYDLCKKIATGIEYKFNKFTVIYTDTTVELTGDYDFTISDVAISAVDTGAMFGSTINEKIQRNINLLTQDIITKENTIYEIRYDFDLNGKTLELPENCTLKFEGGNIGNGNIIGNNTSILAALTRIFNIDASKYYISGTFNIVEWNAIWFGAISDCKTLNNTFIGTDNFSAIQTTINAAYNTNIKNVYIPTGEYKLSKPLLIGYAGYHSFNIYGDFTNGIENVSIGTKLYFDTPIGGLFISSLRKTSIKNLMIVGLSNNKPTLGKSIEKSDFFSGNITNNGVINQGIAVGSIFKNPNFVPWYVPPFPIKYDGYSSSIEFNNIAISGFYVGLGVQLINSSGSEDFHKLEKVLIRQCCYGYVSQGNQSRNQLINTCNINSCWCAYTNCLLDITGNTIGIIQNCNFDGCFKIFEFKGGNGNLYFNSCYAESTYTLGTILTSQNASSISFNNCAFKLLQYKSISILPIINGNIGNVEFRYLYYKNTNILVNSDDDLSKFMIPSSSVIDNFLSDRVGKLLYGNIIIDNYTNSNFTPFFKEITIPEGDELSFSISLSSTDLNLISINDYLVGYYYNASTHMFNEILLIVLSIEETTVTFKFVCNYKNDKRIDTSSQKVNLFKAFKQDKNKLARFTKSYYGYTNPTMPISGDTFYNTRLNKFLFYNGTSWKTLLDQDSIQSGITSKRPTEVQAGFFYFDTTINKPIWWTGTKWVDATGTDV